MKRILIVLLLLICVVMIQGKAFAQLTAMQNTGTTCMDGGDGVADPNGGGDPNQPAPDEGGGGDE
jgi:hypothetical protein